MFPGIRKAVLSTAAIAALVISVSIPACGRDATLSKGQVKNLAAHAETKADHERIAQYFDKEAGRYELEAAKHAELAVLYQKNPPAQPTKFPGSQQTFNHCDGMSKSLSKAAHDASEFAAAHREMAKRVRQ